MRGALWSQSSWLCFQVETVSWQNSVSEAAGEAAQWGETTEPAAQLGQVGGTLIAGPWQGLGLERCSCRAACSQGWAVGALKGGAGDGPGSSLSCGWWGSSGWSRASDGLGGRGDCETAMGGSVIAETRLRWLLKTLPLVSAPACSQVFRAVFPLVRLSADRRGPPRQWPKGL